MTQGKHQLPGRGPCRLQLCGSAAAEAVASHVGWVQASWGCQALNLPEQWLVGRALVQVGVGLQVVQRQPCPKQGEGVHWQCDAKRGAESRGAEGQEKAERTPQDKLAISKRNKETT